MMTTAALVVLAVVLAVALAIVLAVSEPLVHWHSHQCEAGQLHAQPVGMTRSHRCRGTAHPKPCARPASAPAALPRPHAQLHARLCRAWSAGYVRAVLQRAATAGQASSPPGSCGLRLLMTMMTMMMTMMMICELKA